MSLHGADARAAIVEKVLQPAGCTLGPHPANFTYSMHRGKAPRVHVADVDFEGKRMHLMLDCRIMQKETALADASYILGDLVRDGQARTEQITFWKL